MKTRERQRSGPAIVLLTQLLLGDLRRHRGSAVASILAMSVGVAVFVAIQLAGGAARSSFVSTVEALAGRATHELHRSGGLAPDRLVELLATSGVEAAQPIVEGLVSVRRSGEEEELPPLRLYGIDPFLSTPFLEGAGTGVVGSNDFGKFLTQPGAVLLPEAWARTSRVSPGTRIEVTSGGASTTLEVLGFYTTGYFREASGQTAVLDVASAQEALHRVESVDRFDLMLRESAVDAVRATLHPGERLERPAQRGERVARMIDAFRLNLLALGTLALVVGAILVFNAAQFSVVRRHGLLGQLRTLGLTRRLLLMMVLAEVLLFGFVGSVIGVLLGRLLAGGLATPLTQTIQDLYAFVSIDAIVLPPSFAVATVAGGVIVAGVAGVLPAIAAAQTAPRLIGLRSRTEFRYRRSLPRLIALATVGSFLGVGVLTLNTNSWLPGLIAAFLFLGAAAALVPSLLGIALSALARLTEHVGGVTIPLAAGAIVRSLTRTGGAAAALTIALSMTIGVIVMVSSFEKEVRRWIGATLCADVFIGDQAERLSRDGARIPPAAVEEIRALPSVRGLDSLRGVEVPYEGGSIFFCGIEMTLPESWNRIELLEGDLDTARAKIGKGAVGISEPLANRYGLHVGDSLVLEGRHGPTNFPVVAVFRDFSFDRGYGFTDWHHFVEAFGDPGIRNIALYLKPGEDAEHVTESLREDLAGRFRLNVRSNRTLRAQVFEVFDRTFQVTYLLQVISTAMALAGIAVTLLALVLERAHEIAVLRALGARRGQVTRLFVAESLLMSVVPAILALPLGAVIAWLLIAVVNLRAFGWTIHFAWPWSSVLWTCALAIFAGLTATLVPIALVRRQRIALALREE